MYFPKNESRVGPATQPPTAHSSSEMAKCFISRYNHISPNTSKKKWMWVYPNAFSLRSCRFYYSFRIDFVSKSQKVQIFAYNSLLYLTINQDNVHCSSSRLNIGKFLSIQINKWFCASVSYFPQELFFFRMAHRPTSISIYLFLINKIFTLHLGIVILCMWTIGGLSLRNCKAWYR